MILVLVLSVCLWACRTANVGAYEKKENMRSAKIVENVMAKTPTYAKASYKFSCEYSVNGGSPDSFSGNLRVCRDSLMWVSLRSFNIEGFRVLVSNDSVKVINRLKNEYYAEDIYSVYYCVSTVAPKKQKRPNGNYAERRGSVIQTMKVVPGTFKVKNLYLEDLEDGRNAFVEYDKFTRFGDQLFPQTMNIYVEYGNVEAIMKFSISDFAIDDELTFPFKIPAKYTKINLNEDNR